MTNQARAAAVARAEDLTDFQQHIAWELTVLPELLKLKELYTKLLVNAVLSNTAVKVDGGETTREQIAGRVEGINFIIAFMERVIASGEKARKELEEQGLHINSN